VFPIQTIQASQNISLEEMGSKVKFWTVNEQGHEWLFKKARANTGEHWAEKVACELAGLLGY